MFQRRNILCLLLALAVAGCSAATNVGGDSSPQAMSSFASVAVRGSDGPYQLGPGDRVRVKSYGDEDVSGEYDVGSTGYVSIPLVGEIKAAGLTTRGLERAITSKMEGGLAKHPKINVEIAAYAPFYIYGEVKTAGEYSFHPGLTVADAIAMAGGLTYRANENRIYLRHAGSPTQQTVSADVPVRVSPGDNIRVSERIF